MENSPLSPYSPQPEPVAAPPVPKVAAPSNRGIRSHKPDCPCPACTRRRELRAEGKLSLRQKRDLARAEKRLRAEKKRDDLIRLQAAAETQAVLGKIPDVNISAKIADMSPAQAETAMRENSFVSTALRKAGITDEFLATLAREGMSAFNQKIITDKMGNIVDVVDMPDWRNRHAFWRDILMAKKILGSEIDSAVQGGLVIITNDAARTVSGHAPTCLCESCVAAWNQKAHAIQRRAMRETAIELAPTTLEPETTTNSGQDDTEDYSDR